MQGASRSNDYRAEPPIIGNGSKSKKLPAGSPPMESQKWPLQQTKRPCHKCLSLLDPCLSVFLSLFLSFLLFFFFFHRITGFSQLLWSHILGTWHMSRVSHKSPYWTPNSLKSWQISPVLLDEETEVPKGHIACPRFMSLQSGWGRMWTHVQDSPAYALFPLLHLLIT